MHLCPECRQECDCDREPERWFPRVIDCRCPCLDEALEQYDDDYEDAVWSYFAFIAEMNDQGQVIL
jgi:hypothetical protein